MDDDKIIEMYLKRDENAIMLTAEKYGRKIYEVAYNVLYSREDAEECVNDTYLKVWNSIPPAEPREFFLPYLLRIVRNLAIDR